MPLKNGVYILECIPKNEKLGEGAMLEKLLEIAIPNYVELKYIKGKKHFFAELNKNNSKIVHISCHGYENDGKFYIGGKAEGNDICSDEFFENDRLKGRGIIITGCKLGRAGFAKEFMERTQANHLIAPMKDIESFDVAIWSAIFYHHLFTESKDFVKSYDYMDENFKFQGVMKMW